MNVYLFLQASNKFKVQFFIPTVRFVYKKHNHVTLKSNVKYVIIQTLLYSVKKKVIKILHNEDWVESNLPV